MKSRDVVIRALELVAGALSAESDDAAIAAARADLEVLAPEDLLRVAAALAVLTPRQWVPVSQRAGLVQRLEHVRLEIAWEAS